MKFELNLWVHATAALLVLPLSYSLLCAAQSQMRPDYEWIKWFLHSELALYPVALFLGALVVISEYQWWFWVPLLLHVRLWVRTASILCLHPDPRLGGRVLFIDRSELDADRWRVQMIGKQAMRIFSVAFTLGCVVYILVAG